MWTAQLGALLVLLGLVLLVLVSTPRRLFARLAYARVAWRMQHDHDSGKTPTVNMTSQRDSTERDAKYAMDIGALNSKKLGKNASSLGASPRA